jgi:hypothetical protein
MLTRFFFLFCFFFLLQICGSLSYPTSSAVGAHWFLNSNKKKIVSAISSLARYYTYRLVSVILKQVRNEGKKIYLFFLSFFTTTCHVAASKVLLHHRCGCWRATGRRLLASLVTAQQQFFKISFPSSRQLARRLMYATHHSIWLPYAGGGSLFYIFLLVFVLFTCSQLI